ncbi:hypothetical protein [Parabacteroides distasonis]|uniref:hypothetical protein n=1 Tax=Parabacteroides distasonis TaxID=823 RepID=UPI0021C9D193
MANVLTIRSMTADQQTDLLQVESRLKEAELNKSSAYKEYQIALQNLNSLMGVSLDRSSGNSIRLSALRCSRRGCSSSNRPDYVFPS